MQEILIPSRDSETGLIALAGKQHAQFDLDALNLTRGIARQTGQAILKARHTEDEEARFGTRGSSSRQRVCMKTE